MRFGQHKILSLLSKRPRSIHYGAQNLGKAETPNTGGDPSPVLYQTFLFSLTFNSNFQIGSSQIAYVNRAHYRDSAKTRFSSVMNSFSRMTSYLSSDISEILRARTLSPTGITVDPSVKLK